MKTYTGKTVEEAIASACEELGVSETELCFEVSEEKSGLKKKASINVFDTEDAIAFGETYLKTAIESIGIEVEITTTVNEQGIIRMTLNSPRNPILIGRNGRTLQSLNDLVRLAVSNKFKKRFHILLDVADYKDNKYSKIIHIARKIAKDVQRTHIDVQLEPMTSDERRIVHNSLADFTNIATQSNGSGSNRAVVITYVGDDRPEQGEPRQQKEVAFEDRHHHHNSKRHEDRPTRSHDRRPPRIMDDGSLSNYNYITDRHHDDFLKEEIYDDKPKVELEENKVKEPVTGSDEFDDLPSATLTSTVDIKDLSFDEGEDEEKNK